MQFRPTPIRHGLSVPPPASGASTVLAFSMAKAGSTLLFNILQMLTPHVGLTYFSIEDRLFADNVSPLKRPTSIGNVFAPTGYCYGGFRQFPAFPVPILHSSKALFLVRDPRDMITSLYFSLLRSHVVPEGASGGARDQLLRARGRLEEIGINRWAVEQSRNYIRMFEGYVAQGFHWRPNVAIYRYEDVIFHKPEWIDDMVSWCGWQIDGEVLRQVLAGVDVTPEAERPEEHIRQVAPGNHKRYLESATIAAINQALAEYMSLFGYT
jgi:hypothetical protein